MRGCMRKLGILFGVSAAIVLVVGAVFMAYWYRGERLSEQAWDAYYDGKPAEALALYRTVKQQYPSWRFLDDLALHAPAWVPTFEYVRQARYGVPELEDYLHAANLQAAGRVDEAVAAYESYLDEHYRWEGTLDLYISLAREALARLKLQQARAFQENGQYGSAIDTYSSLLNLDTRGGSDCAPEDEWDKWGAACQQADLATEECHVQARAAIPLAFVEWAVALEEQGDYEVYLDKYQVTLREHPDPLGGERVRATLAEVYGGWAAQLERAGEYEQAIRKCYVVLNEYPDTPTGEQTEAILHELYGEWATEISKRADYEGALRKFRAALQDCPAGPVQEEVEETLAELYGEWAIRLRGGRDYESAVATYQTVLRECPRSGLAAQAAVRIAETHGEWAAQLGADGSYEQAIEKYEMIRQRYPDTPTAAQAEGLAAEVYGVWAAQLRATGAYESAIETYLTIIKAYPNTATAPAVETAIAELYEVAADAVVEGEYCTAVSLLGAFARAGSRFAKEATSLMPEALYGCGLREFEAGEYEQAIAHCETLLEDYPDSPLVGDAQAVLVDARVADYRARETGALPPLQVSGDAPPGSAVIVISNDSPEQLEVLLSGPRSTSLTVDRCPTCKVYSIMGPIFCPEKGPKATVTLTPGSYEVVVRALDDPSITPWSGSWSLESGREHFNCFFIVTTFR